MAEPGTAPGARLDRNAGRAPIPPALFGGLMEGGGRGLDGGGTGARRDRHPTPPPIRLAFFVDSMEVGGSELNAVRTLERLDRSRFELRIFHTGWKGPLLARYQALGVPMFHVAVRGFLRPGTLVSGLRLARELRRQRIHVSAPPDLS